MNLKEPKTVKAQVLNKVLYLTDPTTGEVLQIAYDPKEPGISDLKHLPALSHIFNKHYKIKAYPTSNRVFIQLHVPTQQHHLFYIHSHQDVYLIGKAITFSAAKILRNKIHPANIVQWNLTGRKGIWFLDDEKHLFQDEGLVSSDSPDLPDPEEEETKEKILKVPIIQYHREMYENFWGHNPLPEHRGDEIDDYELIYYWHGGPLTSDQDWDIHLQNMMKQGDKLDQIPNAYLYRPASEIKEEYKEENYFKNKSN